MAYTLYFVNVNGMTYSNHRKKSRAIAVQKKLRRMGQKGVTISKKKEDWTY